MPSPYTLLSRPKSPSLSVIRSGMSDTSSVTVSSVVAGDAAIDIANTGITRQVQKRSRKSGTPSTVAPLTPEDKKSRDYAASIYLSRICRNDCMPEKSTLRTIQIEECILQANAEGLRQGRPAILSDKVMIDKVSFIIYYSCVSV